MTSKVRGLVFSLARVTIEFKTAFLVSSGSGDDVRDAVCVVDANGLPALPGPTIAGVLRQADPSRAKERFGYQDGNLGESSKVEVSWAQVHDQDNRPTPFRSDSRTVLDGDPVLRFLRAGVRRDHVRIDARGVVDGNGKFDELVVPAGARFTFELVVHEDASILDSLLSHLASGALRFGGRSRRGLGDLAVVAVSKDTFDLGNKTDRDRFRKLPRDFSEPLPHGVLRSSAISEYRVENQQRWVTAKVELTPQDFWLFGGGEPILPKHFRGDQPYDINPVTEGRIVWTGSGKGEVKESQHSIPAAGIKGALRHRLAFHGHRLDATLGADRFAKDSGNAADWPRSEESRKGAEWAGVNWWFGSEHSNDDSGNAGRLSMSDGWITAPNYGSLDHVSLDRFTQGPMDGALFNEAPLYGGGIALELVIDTHFRPDTEPAHARSAFAKTLRDLCGGRLAIGAGAARGHGFCTGFVTWNDGGKWIGEVPNE
ncbi:MAG: hypothetical protein HY646_06650 [Acidobacteria bacterium]|nr:hypothetical protein [Acidobacteriota bacterium]